MSGVECFFCRIGRGEAAASVIREDSDTVAFLDIYPHAPGHMLVIPKVHCETLAECSDKVVSSLFGRVRQMASLLVERLGAQGLTIGINQGKAAGQAVEHLHVHLMPRFEGDGGGSVHSVVSNPPKESLKDMVEKLKH